MEKRPVFSVNGWIEPPAMKITGRPAVPASNPAPAPVKSLKPHHRPDLLPSRAFHGPHCRRTRLRRVGTPTGKRNSRPETPLLEWKTEERDKNALSIGDEASPLEARRRRRQKDVPVSARKLAAVLWRLNLPESVVPSGGGGSLPRRNGGEVLLGFWIVPGLAIQCVYLIAEICRFCGHVCD